MTQTIKELGTFKVNTDTLLISDPCYDLGIWTQMEVEDAPTGEWTGFVVYDNETERVAELNAVHTDWGPVEPSHFNAYLGHVGVDSGQMTIIEKAQYRKQSTLPDERPVELIDVDRGTEEKEFYATVGDLTLSEQQAGLLKNGVVSSTGWGDGGYAVYGIFDEQGIVQGIKIVFIDKKADEEK